MSKPLELTVYPNVLGARFVMWGPEKRLTDAELAAELHRAASVEYAALADPSGFKPGAQQRAAIQCQILHRFATLPHYDEAPA